MSVQTKPTIHNFGYRRVRDIWDKEPPERVAINELLRFGYTHKQAAQMMKRHYFMDTDQYFSTVKTYNLKTLDQL